MYAEVVRDGRPELRTIAANVAPGRAYRLAVLEIKQRPGWWRVWVDGSVAVEAVRLVGTAVGWRPMATAESWNGGGQACNSFAFRFQEVGARSCARRLVAAVLARTHVPEPRLPAAPARAGGRVVRVRAVQPLARPARAYATILTGVPTRTTVRRKTMSWLCRRTQPCETAWPINSGVFVPCTPTTPPPGQSDSLE